MNELSQLQTWMARALQEPRAIQKDPELVRLSREHIAGNDRLSPDEQLEIYREQFWLRHTSSLVEDFPGLGGILGQSDWERFVEAYLQEFPPRSFSLRDLGVHLPEFVERAQWLPRRELCVDMARLELAYIDVFDAQDPAPLDPVRLASIPEDAWEGARLILSPALRLLSLQFPVVELRRGLRNADTNAMPIPQPCRQKVVIYRSQLQIQHEQVSEGAFALLEALRNGMPLIAACEAAQAQVPSEAEEIGRDIGSWFQSWAQRPFIVDVKV